MKDIVTFEALRDFMCQKPLMLAEKNGDQILVATGIRRGREKLDPCRLQISGVWVGLEEAIATYDIVNPGFSFYIS